MMMKYTFVAVAPSGKGAIIIKDSPDGFSAAVSGVASLFGKRTGIQFTEDIEGVLRLLENAYYLLRDSPSGASLARYNIEHMTAALRANGERVPPMQEMLRRPDE